MVSSAHNVCPKGYYVAIVSTIAESDANHHIELEPGFERLGEIEEKFFGPPIPLYEPLESGEKDNIYISRSYDATSHFETTTGESRYRSMRTRKSATNIPQMMCGIFTVVPLVRSWLLRDFGRTRSLLKSKCDYMRFRLRLGNISSFWGSHDSLDLRLCSYSYMIR